MDVQQYICERETLFSDLQSFEWFKKFIKNQYQEVVFGMEPVRPLLSDYWMALAHYRWVKDTQFVREKEYGGGGLDHFKSAGFLCYWLRRCPPLYDLEANRDAQFAGIRHREPNKVLVHYGNVYAAFDIGFRICRYWESARTDIAYPDSIRDTIAKFSISSRSEYIEDICYTLAEKNISPHSLNMLYKSLFMAFRLPALK